MVSQQFVATSNASGSFISFTPSKMQRLIADLLGRQSGPTNGPSANMASANISGKPDLWINDTGAIDHISCKIDTVTNAYTNPDIPTVPIPNGDTVPIHSLGRVVKHAHLRDAKAKEISALEANNTWTLVSLPSGKCAIDSKWVYKVKFHPDGTVERYKARLVAKGYIQIEECFSMGDSKEKATPMEPNLKLKKDKGKPLKDARKFRQLVGIYATSKTPSFGSGKRILRYVKGTLDYGLLYKRCDNFVLSGFTDADWAGDTNDRHSTSGYCFNTGSAAVSWCSKKQNIVVLSSTEAEYVAATMATQECVWLKRLIGDMFCEVDYAVQIKCDNESAIKLASNPIFHARTKHIEVRYHFVREKVLSEDVELLSVRTNDQVADIFTKALVEPKFQRFRNALGVVSLH
ncbi:hypothetical protein RJ640_012350 [Escallonia rubra]|uniref:Reverse transcriptase Ty1/copia-type domain-containing protein n=1 Tax=Escallonia rubra TaxID=112253 RepID=A0AA88QU15_9ASTE|nr:hypothetical protein RJ640_012350 [Escallonia rubra]